MVSRSRYRLNNRFEHIPRSPATNPPHMMNNQPTRTPPDRTIRGLRVVIAALCLGGLLGGCAKFKEKWDWDKNIPWSQEEELPPPVSRVVAVWSDAVLHQAGRPPLRGFGGRLFFYGREGEAPIKAEGTVMVYAFEETGGERTKMAPDRKFVFPADNLEKHLCQSDVGHSYSFWVPWDRVGGDQKQVSLIARFIPKTGGVVVSDQVTQLLPGRPSLLPLDAPHREGPQVAGSPQAAPSAIRRVTHETPVPGDAQTAAGSTLLQPPTTITTISMSGQLSRRPPQAVARPRTTRPQYDASAGGALAPRPRERITADRAAVWEGYQAARPSTHFSHERSRPLGGPIARLERDHGAWPQSPATPPSGPPSRPAPAPAFGSASID